MILYRSADRQMRRIWLGVFAGCSYVWRTAIDGAGIFAMESAAENLCRHLRGAGIFYFNKFFSAGDVTDAIFT